jgi:hypothetical protein
LRVFANLKLFSDIYDGDTRVCNVSWSWGLGKSNNFQVQDCNSIYDFLVGNWNETGNNIGNVTVYIVTKESQMSPPRD